jgi:transcriptional regulator with XRE-family HTH domain
MRGCLVAMSEPSTHPENSDFCASVGTVLREMRESRQLSRSQLSRRSGVSSTRLGTIERGDICPDDETIARLAPCFGTDAAEIWSRSRATYEERLKLQGFLEDLGIPRETWDEFFALDPEARAAFVDSMALRLPSRTARRRRIEQIQDGIEQEGVDASIPMILDGIAEYGLVPIDYMRASVELEEMPGERAVFTDRLPLSPVTVPIDWLYLFRASYGMDPPNPALLKWWADTRRSAMTVTLKDHRSRTILPIATLERYIRTGDRAPNILLPPDIVASHLLANIELLRTHPHFLLGLADTRLPLIYRIKGDHHVLVTVDGYALGTSSDPPKTTLQFSRPSVVQRFREHFEEEWSRLAHERRDQQAVANWIEEQLLEAGRGI